MSTSRFEGHCLRVSALFLAVSVATAQTTWVVDRDLRPGAQFSDTPAAFLAAADGDVVIVRLPSAPNTYSGGTIAGKGLSVRGQPDASGRVPYIAGTFLVQNQPAGTEVVLDHMGFVASSIALQNCAGTVVVRACAGDPSAAFAATDCAAVHFTDSLFYLDARGLLFTRSNVHFEDLVLWQLPAATLLAPPVRLVDSTMDLVGASTIAGAASPYGAAAGSTTNYSSGPAIDLRGASSVRLSAGAQLMVVATGPSPAPSVIGSLLVGAGPHVVRDPATTLTGVSLEPNLVQSVRTVPSVTSIGTATSLLVEQRVLPNSPTLLLVGNALGTPLPSPIGPLFVDPTNWLTDFAVASPQGSVSRFFVVPPTIPLGQVVAMQSFSLGATGAIESSNPSIAVLF